MDFFIINLGCAKNLVESESLTKYLLESGYNPVGDVKKAEIIIINTCGFIKDAKKESIETILATLSDKSPNSKVIVFGCLVQRYFKELKEAIPEVTLFIPVMPAKEVASLIRDNFPPDVKKIGRKNRIFFTPPSYRYIKILDGCVNFCSYCAIPFIRGPIKSRSIEEIIKEVRDSLEEGVYEFNIIGQDITAYGLDIYGKPKLVELIEEILKIPEKFWLRLLYLYPTRIPDSLINLMEKDERIVHYLDIPIQHVNDRILKLMGRKYTKSEILKIIGKLRKKIPDIVLRTSLITGFPTESEEEFEEVIEFIKDVKFDHLGVFTYSREEGTKACELKSNIPERIKKKRRDIIMREQYKIVREKMMKYKNKVLDCIIEEPVDDLNALWIGRFYGQAPEVDGVVYLSGYETEMGNCVPVKIEKVKNYDLIGLVNFQEDL